jgi:hypothetical protein
VFDDAENSSRDKAPNDSMPNELLNISDVE